MEKVFRMHLKKELKKRIKGKVSVHVYDDTLVIDIEPVDLSIWHYALPNLCAQLSSGVSSRIVATVIVKEYKNYILRQHFYTK